MTMHEAFWVAIQHGPTVIGMITAALAGERTAHKFLKAACQIVFLLAEKPMENHEKRAAAVAMLYNRFPVLARVFPGWMLGKLVDIAWEQVVKPAAEAPSTIGATKPAELSEAG